MPHDIQTGRPPRPALVPRETTSAGRTSHLLHRATSQSGATCHQTSANSERRPRGPHRPHLTFRLCRPAAVAQPPQSRAATGRDPLRTVQCPRRSQQPSSARPLTKRNGTRYQTPDRRDPPRQAVVAVTITVEDRDAAVPSHNNSSSTTVRRLPRDREHSGSPQSEPATRTRRRARPLVLPAQQRPHDRPSIRRPPNDQTVSLTLQPPEPPAARHHGRSRSPRVGRRDRHRHSPRLSPAQGTPPTGRAHHSGQTRDLLISSTPTGTARAPESDHWRRQAPSSGLTQNNGHASTVLSRMPPLMWLRHRTRPPSPAAHSSVTTEQPTSSHRPRYRRIDPSVCIERRHCAPTAPAPPYPDRRTPTVSRAPLR